MTGSGSWAETAEFAQLLEANGFSGMLYTSEVSV